MSRPSSHLRTRRWLIALFAATAAMALQSCSSWWIGSGGWGVSETLPGGVNVGVNGPWQGPRPRPRPVMRPPRPAPPPPPMNPYPF